MKKKLTVLCSFMLVLSICVAVFSTDGMAKTDMTTATIKNYNGPKTETTTSNALGGIVNDVLGGLGSGELSSDKIDSVLGSIEGVSGDIDSAIGNFGDSVGGIGDGFGGIGDALGGIGSGLSDSLGGALGNLGGSIGSGSGTGTVVKTTAPASTTSADIGLIIPVPAATQTPSETQASSMPENAAEGETVDFAATSNPYKKPTATFTAGDKDETIKWLQWIFIYTDYGLKDDGITGVLDDDTIAVVKKLQHNNKMTVDGNITEDVIKAAEVLYYQSILGGDVSAIEVSSDATTGAGVSSPAVSGEKKSDIPVALLIVVIVIIWILAIGGIVLLFVFKKKKIKAAKNADEKTDSEKKENEDTSGVKSLSDLFDEAENKDK